ncbi:hypothetical protein XENORESO_013254 [Xenotaenia resolanae]|uniref:Uncharacterized protein n=1 Tax=Xenotaenia resolanae TaxID=208358 RepID=A0ABV0X2F0_9TELE
MACSFISPAICRTHSNLSLHLAFSLFLDQYRACLVDAIRRLLRPDGMALVFAPERGETLTLFCQLAQQAGLHVSQHQQYDAQVWDIHLKVRNLY